MNGIDDYLLILNVIVCLLAAGRLMNYRRDDNTHKVIPAFFAWGLIVAFGSVPIRAFFEDYPDTNLTDVAINTITCILIWRAGGRVTQTFRSEKK